MMNIQEQEERDFVIDPIHLYDREEAQRGAEWAGEWKKEWLYTSRDQWVKNPMYHGPVGPHPEDPEMSDEEWKVYCEAYGAYEAGGSAFEALMAAIMIAPSHCELDKLARKVKAMKRDCWLGDWGYSALVDEGAYRRGQLAANEVALAVG